MPGVAAAGRPSGRTRDWCKRAALRTARRRDDAGFGLGIVVHLLVRNPAVTKITVVDREPDVIKLVSPLLPKDSRIEIEEGHF